MLAQRVIKTEQIPLAVRKLFKDAAEVDFEGVSLWREICARAVLDACGIVESMDDKKDLTKKNKMAAISDARAWFQSEEDWEEAFTLSGIDGPRVVSAMRKYIGAL